MDISGKKRQWKLLLYISAAIVFVTVIYYSNVLISNMANEERRRIEIWAEAISYKAELVNYTEQFFERIGVEEEKRASILMQAYQRISTSEDEDLTFYSSVFSSNSTIPLVAVNPKGEIVFTGNVDQNIADKNYIWEIADYIADFDSVSVQYDIDADMTVFYKESQIYTDLRNVLDNLIKSFFQEVVISSASVPVLVTDVSESRVIDYNNMDSAKIFDEKQLPSIIEKMKSENKPIEVQLPGNYACYVFYEKSSVLKQLRLLPFMLFFIVVIFVGVAYLLFSVFRRSEQNQVWVGMSKETAHQLGTPISSLMAWAEILKEENVDPLLIKEINKDVSRLETIAQRFSKIGSSPELKEENLIEVIEEFLSYLQTRISNKVVIEFIKPENRQLSLPLNRYLFEWVIENLIKNAVDAMTGSGNIFIDIIEDAKQVHIDIKDSGKGISSKLQKRIFYPGYTSKARGWGLGLTLAKRIIKEYHKGKLFVKSSTMGMGATMRITLNKR